MKTKTRNRSPINKLSPEIICLIFSFLSTREVIKCRRVCSRWTLLVEKFFSLSRVLSLNIATGGTETDWNPKPSPRSLYFQENVSIESAFAPKHRARLCVRERRFSVAFADSIGPMFPQLHSLVIYFDLPDSRTNLIRLVKIIRGCAHVKSFSFVMSNDVRGDIILPTICAEVDTHMRQLSRLDLYVSDLNYIKPYEFQPQVQLLNILPKLEHFSISCTPNKCYRILRILGSKNTLKSLSTTCRLNRKDFAPLFRWNQNLANVNKIQFTQVMARDYVGMFLKHFHKVECLQLAHFMINSAKFSTDWIRTVEQLEHLSELKLFNFSLDAQGHLNEASLPRVTRLTLGSRNLFSLFKKAARTPTVDCGLFVDILAYQFPSLEVLRIFATEREDRTLGDALRQAMHQKLPNVKLEADLNCKAWD